MDHVLKFGEILEAADLEILQRRVAELRRDGIARDVEEAHEALRAGKCRPATPDEIFDEIVS
jgi:hypothetical protein